MDMKLVDGHICNGGGRIKGWIRKYPYILCSLCHGKSIDVKMKEESIDAYNQNLLEKIKN